MTSSRSDGPSAEVGTGKFDGGDNMVKNGRWRRDRHELAPETVPPRPSDEWHVSGLEL
jgi:hypothetical protein